MNGEASRGRLPVCALEALPNGHSLVVSGPAGAPVVVVNDAGEFLAVDDTCPHAGGSLQEGHVDDGLIVCPLHSYSFDLRTGECLDDPALAVDRYRVVVEDGFLWLEQA
ncbi:MAG: Rieske (2Fe-2S) protein [Actinomycetota bacterium]|jgi:3-phenylpropionate/trans-cinnamate dioxygenase ferredoxin component